MDARERQRRKKKNQRQYSMKLITPILVIILLIVALTAGGIALSVHQSKHTTPESTGMPPRSSTSAQEETKETEEAEETETAEENTQEEASEEEEASEAENASEAEVTQAQAQETSGSEDFSAILEEVRTGYSTDASYLSPSNAEVSSLLARLNNVSISDLSDTDKDYYTVIKDQAEVAEKGIAYLSAATSSSGQRLVDVEGGSEYYGYLVNYLSGTDYDITTIHEKLANELNSMQEAMNALVTANPALAQTAGTLQKSTPDDAYLYSNLTASSDSLLKAMALQGLTNGWSEFGIIRAYQTDATLEESMRNYLIYSTRAVYAAYALADVSVHSGGWDLTQVTELFVNYFGAGQEAFAEQVYQGILANPGRYAAVAIGYLELIDIEASLAANTENYTEQVLLDFLFERGPASFRVYRSWLTEQIV